MTNSELDKYIQAARARGVSDAAVSAQLLKSGWSEADVKEALSSNTVIAADLPPPPVPRFGMWISFLYIIFFIALYISATSLGGILFDVVDKIFPDKLNYFFASFRESILRGYIAGLIVAFPMFAGLYVFLRKQLIKVPAVRNIKARKFLIYLTLVATFVIMVIKLIRDVYALLGGNYTLNSMGHFAVIFLIAGSVFVWLFTEVKEDRRLR